MIRDSSGAEKKLPLFSRFAISGFEVSEIISCNKCRFKQINVGVKKWDLQHNNFM